MTAESLPRCPSCQAPHEPEEAFCWMCRRRLWAAAEPKPKPAVPLRSPAGEAKQETPDSHDVWTQPVLFVAFGSVMYGLFSSRSSGAPLLIGMAGILLVASVTGIRMPKTEAKTPLEKFARGMSFLASAIALAVLAAMATILAITTVCMILIK